MVYLLRFARKVRSLRSLTGSLIAWSGYKSGLLIWVNIEAGIVEAASTSMIKEAALIRSHKAISNPKKQSYLIDDGVFASLRSQSSFATLTHWIIIFSIINNKKKATEEQIRC